MVGILSRRYDGYWGLQHSGTLGSGLTSTGLTGLMMGTSCQHSGTNGRCWGLMSIYLDTNRQYSNAFGGIKKRVSKIR